MILRTDVKDDSALKAKSAAEKRFPGGLSAAPQQRPVTAVSRHRQLVSRRAMRNANESNF